MPSALNSRLAKLEAAAGDTSAAFVWQDLHESDAEALERHFGEGPRPKRWVFIRWARDRSEAVQDPAAGDWSEGQ